MKIKNFFKNIPQKSEKELFEPLWKNSRFLLERIISTGQTTPTGEWYEQLHDEWVIVLQGSAILRFETSEHTLNIGDYVLIPAGCRHRVEWTDKTQPTLWLALHAKETAITQNPKKVLHASYLKRRERLLIETEQKTNPTEKVEKPSQAFTPAKQNVFLIICIVLMLSISGVFLYQASDKQLFTSSNSQSSLTSLLFASPPVSAAPPTITRQAFEPEMVWIPEGEFMMGSNDYGWEKPVHQVKIEKGFYMGKYEVMVGEFKAFIADTKHLIESTEWCSWNSEKFVRSDRQPVQCVSWQDAVAYTKWLSQKTGKKYRLPTEAEWEYAARAGTTTKYWWRNTIGKNKANCDDCGSPWDKKTTSVVGSFSANPFGLYDTAGNVWEWTCSDLGDSYDDGSELTCSEMLIYNKILRGGSWNYNVDNMRSANRSTYLTTYRFHDTGFRVVFSL